MNKCHSDGRMSSGEKIESHTIHSSEHTIFWVLIGCLYYSSSSAKYEYEDKHDLGTNT